MDSPQLKKKKVVHLPVVHSEHKAPICWSKYTTQIKLFSELGFYADDIVVVKVGIFPFTITPQVKPIKFTRDPTYYPPGNKLKQVLRPT